MSKNNYTVHVRFYEELNFFIDKRYRKKTFTRTVSRGTTVKAMIEDLGVPHTEVDLVLVNGTPQPLSYRLKSGDMVSVYPVFESFDISSVTKVREKPLRKPAFILDVHLGKLAIYMRMLGLDAKYVNDISDDEITITALRENRTILTRDRGLLKRRIVHHGYYIRSKFPLEQLKEIIRRFSLEGSISPFSRCLRCNILLEDIPEKQIVRGRVPDKVFLTYDRFKECPSCHRIYWRGSHWENMKNIFDSLDL